MVPQFNLAWMKTSDKTQDSARKGHTATTNTPTTFAVPRPTHYARDFSSLTYPDPRPWPTPVPPTTSGMRHPTTTLPPHTAGTNNYPYRVPPRELDTPVVKIIVMGTTGSGKSTFINLVSGSNLGVSRKLGSCTNTVQVVEAFNLDGRRVVLIDTPGFDDTTQSDTDVLRTIAAFLGASYERGDKLTGVLYFHRITDLRMGGTQTRNFRMFRKLCGESALRNVVIVTNMWGGVEPGIGDAREAELMREDIFFKPVLESGARMARHENTVSSAEGIIRLLIDNQPLPLQIQRELVHECKDIVETSAGQELNRELSDQIRKHQEDICVLVEEMEQATRDKDEETRNELEIETRRMREQTWRLEEEARRLASDYWREKNEFQARLAELERARQDGYRGTEFPRYSPRWGGHYDRFPPASSYGSTSTTEQQSVNAPGLFGKDKTSVVNSARTFARNLRERWQ